MEILVSEVWETFVERVTIIRPPFRCIDLIITKVSILNKI